MKCFVCLLTAVFGIFASGCAYQAGFGERSLPGGYREISIPVFKNMTQHTGVEADLTNSLVREFERSKVAKVIGGNSAPVSVEGVIEDIQVIGGGLIPGGAAELRAGSPRAVLATQYTLVMSAKVRLVRNSDRSVIWESQFSQTSSYQAPRIATEGLNSANANYNLSQRRRQFAEMATLMMEQAHSRMTEKF